MFVIRENTTRKYVASLHIAHDIRVPTTGYALGVTYAAKFANKAEAQHIADFLALTAKGLFEVVSA